MTPATTLQFGDVVRFVSPANVLRYGPTAEVLRISEAIARPYGTRTVFVDLRTSNGTAVQWPLRQVRRDTRVLSPAAAPRKLTCPECGADLRVAFGSTLPQHVGSPSYRARTGRALCLGSGQTL